MLHIRIFQQSIEQIFDDLVSADHELWAKNTGFRNYPSAFDRLTNVCLAFRVWEKANHVQYFKTLAKTGTKTYYDK